MTDPLLQLDGLTKSYPGVRANDAVSATIHAGRIHALLGENGAGKSTLVKMIYGLATPDSGTMTLDGQPYAPACPSDARRRGIAMVFQHFSLFDALDVAENVALGMDDPPRLRDLAARIRTVSEAYGLPLDPGRRVGALSAGERQRVEIVRCLLQDPRLLIMDEPTSVLTPQEVEILFRTLRKLAGDGTAILYISHKLDEIRALCSHATILRDGRTIATRDPRDASARELAELMVGQVLTPPARAARATGEVVLQVDGLSLPAASPFGTALHDVAFTLRAGEVLGIAGVAGNGQDELLALLSGERTTGAERVRLNGAAVGHLGPTARRARGLAAAPEERMGHAAAPDMSLAENAYLSGAATMGLVRHGFVDWPGAADFAADVIARFDVRTSGPHAPARALSGGNLQKFVIGREIAQRPRVIVVNQPTWGVDAAAAATIRQALLDMADAGAGVIVISQDLDELLQLADSFAALNGGRLSAARPARGLTVDQIGLLMGGAGDMHVAEGADA